MKVLARIYVTLKTTVNDPQGTTIMSGLKSLGFEGVQDVRVGKFLTVVLEAADQKTAQAQVDEMCRKLLANPVIESYRFEVNQSA